ncbi:hypothetical protein RB195_009708 [Necator americanus]|uniref:Mos1 transposase HTH domain-containing protein n=1 Tax=Necator americanus TaxID=51031 RepID=A0ABR1CUI6_NECAM
MAGHSIHIRHLLLYESESGHPAAEAHRNISQVFATEAPSERSVRAWFQRFKAENKKLEDEPRSDRLTAISFDELKNLTEQHPYEGVRYFAASLCCSLSTVSNGLRSFGMVKKLGQWLPHALSDGNRQRRLDICTQLLSRSRRFAWLDTIVTGDEKWVLYVNHTHKRAWCAGDEMPDPFVKTEIHEVMLSVWWEGVSWNLPFRTAAGQHESYCRGLLRSTAKTGRQDPQEASEAQQRSPAAR